MKKISLKILGVLTIIIMFAQVNVFAATKSELKENSSDTDKKIEEAKEELEGIQAEKSDTLKQVESLITEISSYESEIDKLDEQISKLNNDIKDAENKLNQKQEDYKKEKELLEKRLVATYEAGETSYLDVLLSSSSLTDLISNYYFVTEITRNDKELMEEIKKEEEEIEKAKTTLENSKSELNNSKVMKQSKATQLKQAKNQKDSYVSKLNEDEKNTQEQLEQFERDKRDIQAQLAAIAKKEAEQAANSGNSNNNITNNPSASGYIRPIVGYGITCGWMGYANHTGVDFSGAGISGKPILAAKSGTVVTSTALKNSNGTYRSYGEYIVINHHDGTMTLYAHGAPGSRLVSVGQKVSQGQQIMSVGTTGNSTGYHLHFEVRVNGVPVNPAPYLK
ncbi:MAG: peptidoglycan DD-metalloendopeptidase family protein [Clostridium sp.]|nr:peptidoglycan DD-metalloendopeptidase family protein [Clostridium sp.]